MESRSDWDIYKGIAKTFSVLCQGHLGTEKDLVALPILHDTPAELGQAFGVEEWKKGEIEAIPGKTMPALIEVVRDYPNTYKKFTALGPLMTKIGNGGKGIAWNTEKEVEFLGALNRTVTEEGISKGLPRISTDIDASRGGAIARPRNQRTGRSKAWQALEKITGRQHSHLARPKEEEKIRFRDIQSQPAKSSHRQHGVG